MTFITKISCRGYIIRKLTEHIEEPLVKYTAEITPKSDQNNVIPMNSWFFSFQKKTKKRKHLKSRFSSCSRTPPVFLWMNSGIMKPHAFCKGKMLLLPNLRWISLQVRLEERRKIFLLEHSPFTCFTKVFSDDLIKLKLGLSNWRFF